MVLAYDFPLLGVFWSLLMFALFVLWIFIVIWCFIDNFRRRDHHGLAKALWFLFIVFVPIIGVFSYLVTRRFVLIGVGVSCWPVDVSPVRCGDERSPIDPRPSAVRAGPGRQVGG